MTDDDDRCYAIDVPAGRRVVVSATSIPPQGSYDFGQATLKLIDPDGKEAGGILLGVLFGIARRQWRR